MVDSEKELRKEIEYLLSLDDGYSDMIRDIQDDCMELNEVVPKVVRDVYVIGLFEGWGNEYHSCKTIEELKSLKEKIQNHFGEVYATWDELEKRFNKWWWEHASEEEKERVRKLEEELK